MHVCFLQRKHETSSSDSDSKTPTKKEKKKKKKKMKEEKEEKPDISTTSVKTEESADEDVSRVFFVIV